MKITFRKAHTRLRKRLEAKVYEAAHTGYDQAFVTLEDDKLYWRTKISHGIITQQDQGTEIGTVTHQGKEWSVRAKIMVQDGGQFYSWIERV